MWYVIIAEDIENSLPLRKEHRPAHLARLQALQAEGRVLTAGPNPAIDADDPGEAGFSGSVMIVDFPSLTEAKVWADADPFVAAGVYGKVTVKPYKQTI